MPDDIRSHEPVATDPSKSPSPCRYIGSKGGTMAESEQKSPVEDLDKARTHYMLASVAGVCLFAGLAEFKQPRLDVLGLEVTNTAFLPVLLVVLWLYFCQRFTSLSAAKHEATLLDLTQGWARSQRLVLKVFPPSTYGPAEGVQIRSPEWSQKHGGSTFLLDGVFFGRRLLRRDFIFSYLFKDDTGYVHFVPSNMTGPPGQSGTVRAPSWRFFRVLLWEWVQLAKAVQREPLIGYYYAPRLLGWAAVASFAYWLAHKVC